jgi:hypothetical protein
MKAKLFAITVILAVLCLFSANVNAQTLTSDIVFLKIGYVPIYSFEAKDALDNKKTYDHHGFGFQGEYNLNFNNFWLGFGLEWQMLYYSKDVDRTYQFLTPQVSAKFAALGGLYVGIGFAGKYLIASKEAGDPTKKIDLWINAILGYYLPIGEAVFLDLEGKFGYNLTQQQFKENGAKIISNYDIVFYVGVGYRATASEY